MSANGGGASLAQRSRVSGHIVPARMVACRRRRDAATVCALAVFLPFRPAQSAERGAVRIALVTEYYYPHLGGVTEHVHNLALQLQRRGHPTIVVTGKMERPARCVDLDHDAVDPDFVFRVGTSRTIYSAGSFARVTTGVGL